MFGIHLIKVDETKFVKQVGIFNLMREGKGKCYFDFAPLTTVSVVPTGAEGLPFSVESLTLDFQHVTIEGHVRYEVADAEILIRKIDFTLSKNRRDYAKDDRKALPHMIRAEVQMHVGAAARSVNLQEILRNPDGLARKVSQRLEGAVGLTSLGIRVTSVAILSINPKPEVMRALEAEARESILGRADNAAHARQMEAVRLEGETKARKLQFQIAQENSEQEAKHKRAREDMDAKIDLETKNAKLISREWENVKSATDLGAAAMKAIIDAASNADFRTVAVLANDGVKIAELVALMCRTLREGSGQVRNLSE